MLNPLVLSAACFVLLSLAPRPARASCAGYCKAFSVAPDCTETELVLDRDLDDNYLFRIAQPGRVRLRIHCLRHCSMHHAGGRIVPLENELDLPLETVKVGDKSIDLVRDKQCGNGVVESTADLPAGLYGVEVRRSRQLHVVTEMVLHQSIAAPSAAASAATPSSSAQPPARTSGGGDITVVLPPEPTKSPQGPPPAAQGGGCAGCHASHPSHHPSTPLLLLTLGMAAWLRRPGRSRRGAHSISLSSLCRSSVSMGSAKSAPAPPTRAPWLAAGSSVGAATPTASLARRSTSSRP